MMLSDPFCEKKKKKEKKERKNESTESGLLLV